MGFSGEGLRFRFANLGGIFSGGLHNKDHDASGSVLSPLFRKTNTTISTAKRQAAFFSPTANSGRFI